MLSNKCPIICVNLINSCEFTSSTRYCGIAFDNKFTLFSSYLLAILDCISYQSATCTLDGGYKSPFEFFFGQVPSTLYSVPLNCQYTLALYALPDWLNRYRSYPSKLRIIFSISSAATLAPSTRYTAAEGSASTAYIVKVDPEDTVAEPDSSINTGLANVVSS